MTVVGAEHWPIRGTLPHWYNQHAFGKASFGVADDSGDEAHRGNQPIFFVFPVLSKRVNSLALRCPVFRVEAWSFRVLAAGETVDGEGFPQVIDMVEESHQCHPIVVIQGFAEGVGFFVKLSRYPNCVKIDLMGFTDLVYIDCNSVKVRALATVMDDTYRGIVVGGPHSDMVLEVRSQTRDRETYRIELTPSGTEARLFHGEVLVRGVGGVMDFRDGTGCVVGRV